MKPAAIVWFCQDLCQMARRSKSPGRVTAMALVPELAAAEVAG